MRTGPPPSSWLAEILRAAQHRGELGVHIDAEVEAVLLLAVHDGLISSRRPDIVSDNGPHHARPADDVRYSLDRHHR
ncbi:hypothetical protein [Pilimelia columellifera]|uniref:Uncharacterized protein n=1 Tax=Pilimelia columellifera subsp. columellifera TaxID=706583 RepID=A0ABP6B1C1_9ACTN